MEQLRKPAAIAVASAFALMTAAIQPAFADAETDQLRSELDQLKRELRELRSAINQQKETTATKQDVQAVQAEVKEVRSSAEGTGLGRNSIYQMAGYGDVTYANQSGGGARAFSGVSFNPIFHYQYKDFLFFETELEAQLLANGSTQIALEYANLNYFVNDYLVAFAGQFLSPVGYFRQNLHPSWINKFTGAPPGFGHEGAAPTSDVGAGVRGGFKLGSIKSNYALYVGNGPRLELNGGGDEIEAIEFEGATSNVDKKMFIGGRFGIIPIRGLQLGLSAGTSEVAVVAPTGVEPTRSYQVGGFDVNYQYKGFDLRGEYIRQKVDSLATSVAPDGGAWSSRYLQAAYRFPGTGFEPVLRWTKYKSPHSDQRQKQAAFGINYWLAPNSVVKLGYESNSGDPGQATNNDRTLLQFAYGF